MQKELRQGLPLQDPKIQKLAKSKLNESIDSFITSCLHLKEFRDYSDTPGPMMQAIERSVSASGRMIDYFARLTGETDPVARIQARSRELLARFKEGKFYTRAGAGDLGPEDRSRLEEMLHKPETGGLKLEEGGQEERERFEAYLKYLERLPNIVNEFSVAGIKFRVGSWAEVDYWEKDQWELVAVSLKPGRKIVIEVSEGDENVFPQQEELIDGLPETFPTSNALFHSKTDQQDPRKRIFTCLEESEDLENILGSYSENIALLEQREETEVAQHIDPHAKAQLRSILARDIGINEEKLTKIDTASLLRQIMQFVGDKISGEEVHAGYEKDMEYFLKQYSESGRFPGDCKTSATVMAGFCETLNLPARVVEGSVIYQDDGRGGMHMWPEVYLPSIKQWVPIDPLQGTFPTYPSEGFMYIMTGKMYPKKEQQLRVKVDYYDNA